MCIKDSLDSEVPQFGEARDKVAGWDNKSGMVVAIVFWWFVVLNKEFGGRDGFGVD